MNQHLSHALDLDLNESHSTKIDLFAEELPRQNQYGGISSVICDGAQTDGLSDCLSTLACAMCSCVATTASVSTIGSIISCGGC